MRMLCVVIGALALIGCQTNPFTGGNKAQASLESKSGSSVTGTVDFVEKGDKIQVMAKVSGLKPNSEHGFHVHEKGDCSSADGLSAGGHFNPEAHPHGGPGQEKRHAGDLPNLMANSRGEATATFEVDKIRVDDGKLGILNRAVVVHVNPDDYVSQPVGNAGGRLACGVIRKI